MQNLKSYTLQTLDDIGYRIQFEDFQPLVDQERNHYVNQNLEGTSTKFIPYPGRFFPYE